MRDVALKMLRRADADRPIGIAVSIEDLPHILEDDVAVLWLTKSDVVRVILDLKELLANASKEETSA